MKKFKTNSSNVREIFAIRNVSENFEWRIRQHSAEQKVTKCHVLREVSGLTRVSGASRRRRTAFNAFTMAEILLSLTIIGVVAAITLPSLTGNINERTWNTQRKALYARMSQAIALMPALNGYGTYTEDESGNTITDNATETFINAGLSKVLKINNICSSDKISDCGFSVKLTTQNASNIDTPLDIKTLNNAMVNSDIPNGYGGKSIYNTKAVAFETANGESILTFYNPRCVAYIENKSEFVQDKMCANFIYDLNGKKVLIPLEKISAILQLFILTIQMS